MNKPNQPPKNSFSWISYRISLLERVSFTRNLSVMIRTGLPLVTSLAIIAKQVKNASFKKVILDIRNRVQKGQTMAESLANHPKVFSQFYKNMVRVGEEAGTLESTLAELAKQMKKDYQLRSKLKGAMIYPGVILFTMVVMGFIMLTVIVPRMMNIFDQFKITLPPITAAIVWLSTLLANNILVVIISFVVILSLLRYWFFETKSGQKTRYRLILATPLLGRVHRQFNTALFARNMSSLTNSGVPITRALKTTAHTHNNPFYQEALLLATKQIQAGHNLHQSLSLYPKLYPELLLEILDVGEQTGELNNLLEHLADFYEEEIDQTTRNLSVIIEPALLILVGAVVGLFAVAMLQPMYSILQGV